MTPEELVGQALAAMKFAYVPYSGFTVGAALLEEIGSPMIPEETYAKIVNGTV